MFLWQAVQNILSICMNLSRRGITSDIVCIQFGFHTENDKHILFDYDFSKTVLDLLPLGDKWRQISALSFRDFFYSFLLKFDHKDMAVFATCCWLLWYAYNKRCFEGQCSSGSLIASQTLHYIAEYSSLHGTSSSSIQLGPVLSYMCIVSPPNSWNFQS